MVIPIIYEVPLFLFVFLACYTVYELFTAKKGLGESAISKIYSWFIGATIFFTLWGVDHIYHDLVPLPENLKIFFHYVISHGFLLISMFCITIAAKKMINLITDKK